MIILKFDNGISATAIYDEYVGAMRVEITGLSAELSFHVDDSALYETEEMIDLETIISWQTADKIYFYRQECEQVGINYLATQEEMDNDEIGS
jgi:hypothetical protein